MLLDEIARASADVAATPARLAKVERLAACLRVARPEEVPVLVFSDPVVKQDRIAATDVRDLLVELALDPTTPGKV